MAILLTSGQIHAPTALLLWQSDSRQFCNRSGVESKARRLQGGFG